MNTAVGIQASTSIRQNVVAVSVGAAVFVAAFGLHSFFSTRTTPPQASSQVSGGVVTTTIKSEGDGRTYEVVSTNEDPYPKDAATNFLAGDVIVKFRTAASAQAVKATIGREQRIQSPLRPSLAATLNDAGVVEATSLLPSSALAAEETLLLRSSNRTKEATEELVTALIEQEDVVYAHPNYILKTTLATSLTPTQLKLGDPYLGTSGAWGQSFRNLWGLYNVKANIAWTTTKGAGATVAVIDTGLDASHPDITNRIWNNPGEVGLDSNGNEKQSNEIDDDENGYIDDWRGYDFVTMDPEDWDDPPSRQRDNDPDDTNSHGTHVSGIVAAEKNNEVGIVGVAPQSHVMPIRGLDANGSGRLTDLIAGIYYAADNGADVINMSWGGYGMGGTGDFGALIDAAQYAHDMQGATLVAAAGNYGTNVGRLELGFFPAAIPEVIAVAAVDHENRRAEFSNYGEAIDVTAPGGGDFDPENITEPFRSILSLRSTYSCVCVAPQYLRVGDRYLRQAGTSMAAPFVSGSAALVLSVHPEYSPEQVRQALRASAADIGNDGWDVFFGQGIVDAAAALNVQDPLEVYLGDIAEYQNGVTSVRIPIRVGGSALASWKLEYLHPVFSSTWITITNGTTPFSGDYEWNIADLPEFQYTFRLVATNTSGRSFEDTNSFYLDQTEIFSPRPGATIDYPTVTPGSTITLTGNVNPAHLLSYTLAVDEYSTPIVTLPNGGTQPVFNGTIGSWDTTGVPEGFYTIRVQSNVEDGYVGGDNGNDFTRVLVLREMHNGSWPLNLTSELPQGSYYSPRDQMTSADVDDDGDKELLFGYERKIYVVDHTGSPLPGWPIELNLNDNPFAAAPAVGDIDGDGKLEIVAFQDSQYNYLATVYAWEVDGTPVEGWPVEFQRGEMELQNPEQTAPPIIASPVPFPNLFAFYETHTAPTIADMNGDGMNEVILHVHKSNFGERHSFVYVFRGDGSLVPGWPVTNELPQYPWSRSHAVVANLDGDVGATKEIVVATDMQVSVFSSSGESLATIPGDWYKNDPSVGDITGDGMLDIVISDTMGNVYAYNQEGELLPGWPSVGVAETTAAPVLADIDGDGDDEVFFGDNGRFDPETGKIIATLRGLNGDGTALPGWPVNTRDQALACSSWTIFGGYATPAVADITGDGIPEIIAPHAGCMGGPETLSVYSASGMELPGYPFPTAGVNLPYGNYSPVVGDVDNDGFSEISWFDSSLRVYLWDLDTAWSGVQPWPMSQHDAAHSGSSE